jgi:phenylacetate-coenzyme A ligase PaaK-like adenylate-forming protein
MGYSYRRISKYFSDNDMLSIKGRKFTPQLVERTLFKYYKNQRKYRDYKLIVVDYNIESL